MESKSIFQENESQVKENCITYSDLLEGDKYVSQFLNIVDIAVEDNEDSQNVHGLIEMEPQELVEEIQQKEPQQIEEQPKQEEKQIKLTSFHNFQKHLVTTIRYVVQPQKLFGQGNSCESKIWDSFMNSHKLNKTLVTILLGDIAKEDIRKLNSYGFGSIMSEFQTQQIQKCQANLIQGIIQQLKQVNLTKQLTNRRMRNKQDFVVYFKQFLKEVQKGDLQKRMAKCTKILKKRNANKNKL